MPCTLYGCYYWTEVKHCELFVVIIMSHMSGSVFVHVCVCLSVCLYVSDCL